MDSLTQIVLGAACGEVTLGKKEGNRALLWGAIAGTIPDLDTLSSLWLDVVDSNYHHRAATHSILFALVMAPVFGWLVSKIHRKQRTSWKAWSNLFFWGFFTHPLLDSCTTWGTKLFWPFTDWAISIKSIFVIDPLYTLPFLICIILASFMRRSNAKRRKLAWAGIAMSTFYLALTLLLKGIVYEEFEKALENQFVEYRRLDTRPSPLNSILWAANVETDSTYLLGYRSLFDQSTVNFSSVPKKHHLIQPYRDDFKVKRLATMSDGWYTIEQLNDSTLVFNDLRFGRLENFEDQSGEFVFSYLIHLNEKTENGDLVVTQRPNNFSEGGKLLKAIWKRMLGK